MLPTLRCTERPCRRGAADVSHPMLISFVDYTKPSGEQNVSRYSERELPGFDVDRGHFSISKLSIRRLSWAMNLFAFTAWLTRISMVIGVAVIEFTAACAVDDDAKNVVLA